MNTHHTALLAVAAAAKAVVAQTAATGGPPNRTLMIRLGHAVGELTAAEQADRGAADTRLRGAS